MIRSGVCRIRSSRQLPRAHHLAKIVTAAVYSDALHIEEGVVGLKQRAHELALAGASAA